MVIQSVSSDDLELITALGGRLHLYVCSPDILHARRYRGGVERHKPRVQRSSCGACKEPVSSLHGVAGQVTTSSHPMRGSLFVHAAWLNTAEVWCGTEVQCEASIDEA